MIFFFEIPEIQDKTRLETLIDASSITKDELTILKESSSLR